MSTLKVEHAPPLPHLPLHNTQMQVHNVGPASPQKMAACTSPHSEAVARGVQKSEVGQVSMGQHPVATDLVQT